MIFPYYYITMVPSKSNESIVSESEWTAFAFVCYGHPSDAEIQKFCALCGYKVGQIERALRSLSKKGLIVIHRHGHRRKGHGLYAPIFYMLTKAGSELFKKNYIVLMDFLASQIFKCTLRGNSKITNRLMEQRVC